MNDAGAHVVIIGGGITGLTAAYRLATLTRGRDLTITVVEADNRLGGKIKTSPFAGQAAIDEGPDAYLARVPHAVALAHELGLDSSITHPASGHAAIVHDGLQRIPEGLLLGVPTGLGALVRSPLLSWRGKARAALEPFLPTSPNPQDSIGMFIRQRFGTEVHERLVDPLVGSIYAADTMNFSLEMVPQLAALAHERSILVAARRAVKSTPAPTRPVFDAPIEGMGSLIAALAKALATLNVDIITSTAVTAIAKDTSLTGQPRYRLSLEGATDQELLGHAVIVTTPAQPSAGLFDVIDPTVSNLLGTWDHSSVIMVTLQTVETDIAAFAGLSGYLVPKPIQDRVTAVSFGSNKWTHWRPTNGSMILRVSMGRDGAPVDDIIDSWDDAQLVQQVLDEVACHTGVLVSADNYRVTRWARSFPQYRPGHAKMVGKIEKMLVANAPGVLVAGASMRGIGLPACVSQADRAAKVTLEYLDGVL